jgi:hypothetical protein
MTDAPKLSGSQVTAAACVAVVVPGLGAWVGAHTGTKGTVIGTAIGAVLSVLTGWLVLRLSYHTRSGLSRVPWRKAKPWHYVVAAVAVFVVAMAAVTGVEAGVLHRSLSASVTGSGGTGTTLGTVVANNAARPSVSSLAPYSASPAPATPTTVTPTAGGTPGTPPSPVTVTPAPSVSTNVPPTGAASPAPSPREEPS